VRMYSFPHAGVANKLLGWRTLPERRVPCQELQTAAHENQ
jgi:hypothetical protein